MAEFQIKDEDLVGLKGKVVIVTGGSSGIGLATVELLISSGAKVVSADIQDPPAAGDFLFVKTDVRNWAELCTLFKKTKEQYGRIDKVFANAGIGPRANYLELSSDANGDLQEPIRDTLDINFNSVVNTASLAVHYLKGQAEGGSIVIMCSSTALHPVRAPDYSSAKAGVLGFGRGLARLVESANLPINITLLAPSWTSTQVLPNVKDILTAVNHTSQDPSIVARAVIYLMIDTKRHGEVILINEGKYTEIEKSILLPAYEKIKGDGPSDDEILRRIFALSA